MSVLFPRTNKQKLSSVSASRILLQFSPTISVLAQMHERKGLSTVFLAPRQFIKWNEQQSSECCQQQAPKVLRTVNINRHFAVTSAKLFKRAQFLHDLK